LTLAPPRIPIAVNSALSHRSATAPRAKHSRNWTRQKWSRGAIWEPACISMRHLSVVLGDTRRAVSRRGRGTVLGVALVRPSCSQGREPPSCRMPLCCARGEALCWSPGVLIMYMP
jgi:hypothetical protein